MRIRTDACDVTGLVLETQWHSAHGSGYNQLGERGSLVAGARAIQPGPHLGHCKCSMSMPVLLHDDHYEICILYCDYYVNISICHNDYYVICVVTVNVNANEHLTLTYVS